MNTPRNNRTQYILKRLFLLLFGFITFHLVVAQETETNLSSFTDELLITEINPLHGFGIFTFNTPFYMGNSKAKSSRFSVGYSLGNTWHPKSTIYYPQNLTPLQKQEVNDLYITDRPQYFEQQGIATKQKTICTDGILQNLSLTYMAHFLRKSSVIVKLNTYTLSGGSSPIYYLASDRFIEKIHSWVGLEDNFGRKIFPYNQSNLFFQDENGRTIQIDKAKSFLGTFDFHVYQLFWQKERTSSLVTFQGGAHFTVPLNRYYPKIAGGLSTSLLYRQKLFPAFYTDLALDCSVHNNALVSLGTAPNLIDRTLRITAKSYMSVNLITKHNRTLTMGLICNYQDSFLKGNIFNYSQDNYRDLGITYLKSGDVWEGTVVNKTPRLSKLTPASMYYFSLKPYFFWGIKIRKSEFYLTICEDYPLVNNAPDIQYGIQFTRKMGW